MHNARRVFRTAVPIVRILPRQSTRNRTPLSSMSDSSPAGGGARASSTLQDPPSTPTSKPLPLPEPPTASTAQKLDVSGDGTTVKLDHLGPVVVNQDGSLSRIGNWDEMSEPERKNTVRILTKRNAARLAALRSQEDGQAA